jgi:hypothetical protein
LLLLPTLQFVLVVYYVLGFFRKLLLDQLVALLFGN